MGKDSFLIYKCFYQPISEFTDEQLGRLFRAIFQYQLGNKRVSVRKDIEMAFNFFKNQFSIDDAKYQKIVERNRKNGLKGGVPKKCIHNPKNPMEPKEPSGVENNPKNPMGADNDISNDISNIERDITNVISPKNQKSESIDWEGFMNYYNETFAGKLPAIKTITKARKEAVKARIAEYGKESVREVYQAILESGFLLGHNDKNWRADFDWIFRPTNYIKIIEGKYKNHNNENHESNRGTYTSKQEANDYALSELMRRRDEIERGMADETPKPW